MTVSELDAEFLSHGVEGGAQRVGEFVDVAVGEGALVAQEPAQATGGLGVELEEAEEGEGVELVEVAVDVVGEAGLLDGKVVDDGVDVFGDDDGLGEGLVGVEAMGGGVSIAGRGADGGATSAVGGAQRRVGSADGPGAAGCAVGFGGGTVYAHSLSIEQMFYLCKGAGGGRFQLLDPGHCEDMRYVRTLSISSQA